MSRKIDKVPFNEVCTSVDGVLITTELDHRPTRAPDYKAESQALAALSKEMAQNPKGVLQKLGELVLELCHADSAGISVLEPGGDHGILRWHAAVGAFAPNLNGTMPREASPCGVVMARNSVLLFNEAERYFPALREAEPHCYENLLAPWTVNGQPVGTVWAIAHTAGKRFDMEDVRLLQSLASFASASYQMVTALDFAQSQEQYLSQRVAESTQLLSETNERLQKEVAQRRQAEAVLLDNQVRLQAALSIETVGVLFFNLDGNIVDANSAFQRMSGYTLEELSKTHWDRLTPTEFMGLTTRAADELATMGRTAPYEKQLFRKDGTRWWGLFAPTRISGSGTASNCVEFILDITAGKQAQEALKEADRHKDEFLAMLAHELRNPLAPIAAAADLLTLGRIDEARIRQTSGIIKRQVGHMTGLVDDLLDVSRVTRGRVKLDKTVLDAKKILYDAVEQVRPLIEMRRHHLAVHTSPEAGFVCGDVKRLVQVITNLLNNAAKYTPEGGEIVLGMDVDGSDVKLSVSDNGIGIAPELHPTIFDLFTQADRASDRSQGGLGIGLALVRSLVELHGGRVTVHSQGIGKGSRFVVYLPRVNADVASPHAERQVGTQPLPGKTLKVLIVDDNTDAAQMLGMFIEELGHEVIIEHHPKRAIERARSAAPEVCLLDIGLPDMDGNELAAWLRRQPETAESVLIAVTGYGQDHDRDRAFSAGFDHHFAKPIDSAKLLNLLSAIGKS